jgi:glycosyltransferase involved in cell wall biosynthesis
VAETNQSTAEKTYGKMKVCICTNLFSGSCDGGVNRILKFAKNVSKHGANVYLVDRSTKKSLFALILDGDKYYAIENGKSYERYYPFHVRFLLPGIVKFLQEALNLWISLLTRTDISEVGYSYLIDPYLIVKLFFICKKEEIDLIQCEFPFTTLSAFVIKKVIGIPLIYDAHNIESERIGSMTNVSKLHVGVIKKMEIMSCNVCDSVFAVSESDRAQLLSWGIPEKKVTVIPNSVELDVFSPRIDGSRIRDKYGLFNAFVIIFHGFLSYPPNREAAWILLDLFPSLLKKHSSVYLLLVGKNPPKTSHPNVIATGFVENIPEYIAAADLAVVPLLSGGGTKLKMLEYMACGKAVVSTIKGAEGLNLQNRRDVLMTKYPDLEFIDSILQLIEDSDMRKEIGTNARKRIELFYDWEKTAERVVQVYGQLICAFGKKRHRID